MAYFNHLPLLHPVLVVKKNIMIFVNALTLGGGAERIAAEVGTRLVERDYNVCILERHDAEKRYNFNGDLITLHKGSLDKNLVLKLLRGIHTTIMLPRICRQRQIDIVMPFLRIPSLLAVLNKMMIGDDPKLIIVEQNNPRERDANRRFHGLIGLIMKYVYSRADVVVASSDSVKEILNKDYSVKKIRTIHNAVDINGYRKLADDPEEKHRPLFGNGFVFINMGRLVYQKGQWHLLRAFSEVLKKCRDTRLVILGKDGLHRQLEELTKELQIEDSVYFLGIVDNVFPYLRKSDCFVLSSLFEGCPLALIEALSQNLPIISTDCIAGQREILCPGIKPADEIEYPYPGGYGVLTKPFENKAVIEKTENKALTESEQIMADTMIRMYADREFRKRYTNGLERARSFNIDLIMDQWEKVLSDLIRD